MFLKIISSGLIAGFVYQYFLPMQFGIATIPLVGQTLIAATLFIASHVTLTMCSKLFNWLRGFTFASLVKESVVVLLSVISVYLPMTLVSQLAVYFMGLSLAINSILTLTAVTSVYGIFKFALGKLSKKAAAKAKAAEEAETELGVEISPDQASSLEAAAKAAEEAAKAEAEAAKAKAAAKAEAEAATKIPSVVRGHQVKQEAAAKLAAATKIQSVVRGNKGREEAKEAKEAKAATMIQSVVRGKKGRGEAKAAKAAKAFKTLEGLISGGGAAADTQNNFTEQLKAGIFNFTIFPQLKQGSDEDVPRAAIRTIMDYQHQMFKKLTDNEQIIFIATMITKLHELYSPKERGEYRSSLIDQNVKFYFQHIQIRDFDKLSQILGRYSNKYPDATFSIAMNVLIPLFSCLYIQDESKTEDRQGVFKRIGISYEVLVDRNEQLRKVIEPFHEKFDCEKSDDCNPVLAKFANMAIDLKSGNANQYNLLVAKMTLVESTPEGDFYLYQLGINQYQNNQRISSVISKALLQEGGKQAKMIQDFTSESSEISEQAEDVAKFVQLISSDQSRNRQEGEQNAELLSQAKADDEAAKRQADVAKRQADAAKKELAEAAAKALAKEEPVGEISAPSLDARGVKSEKQVPSTTLEDKKKQLLEKIWAQVAANKAAAEAGSTASQKP